MVDFIGGIVEKLKQDAGNVINEKVVKPVTGAVTAKGREITEGITDKFTNQANIAAITKGLPDKFDPRENPHMVRAIELLLQANKVAGKPDGNLDGKDLNSLNKFGLAQGNKAVTNWEDFRTKDLNSLLEAAAAKNTKNSKMDGIIAELNTGVKEMTAAHPNAPAPDAEQKSGIGGIFNRVIEAHEENAAEQRKKEAAKPAAPASPFPSYGMD